MRNVKVLITADPPVPLEAKQRPGYAHPDQFDPTTNIWTIPELEPYGLRTTLLFTTVRGNYPNPYVTVQAEIIGSLPPEGAGNRDNNQTVKKWIYAGNTVRSELLPNALLNLGVDNRSPEPGENPVFSVSVSGGLYERTGLIYDQVGVVVKVALSEGLVFASTPSPPSGTSFSRTSSTAGVWRLGSGEMVPGTLSVPVRLSLDAGDAPPLNRRCLSAQIVASVPSPSLRSGEPHTLCLGGEIRLVLSEGDALYMRHYPQANICAFLPHLCPEGDSAVIAHVGHYQGPAYRPEDLIIVVDPEPLDPPVTIGGTSTTTYHWATGHVISNIEDDDRFPGVRVVRRVPSRADAESRRFTISDVTPKERPGAIAELWRWFANGQVNHWEGLNPDKSDKLVDTIVDTHTSRDFTRLVVFSEPGVYKVNVGMEHTRRSDETVFSATSTLTYIVGALSELQVHDAGLHGRLPEGQQAYTLRAENNLDGTVEQVEVALTGVPEGAAPEVSSDGGRYDRGACDENGLCEGIWKIGDLESREYRYLSGRSDGPTLTLLVDGNPNPITATIASTKTQRVTAGGNSYTIEVTDLDDSNSKDVSVAVGTGRGEPDPEAPVSLRVDQFGRIALLRWETVEKVSRWPVDYYQVQRGNQVLDVEPKEALYLDLQAGGNHVYRVRAVNEFGDPGPWSLPAGGTDVLAQTAELAAPTGLTATPGMGDARRIDLSWFAPSGETGLRYIIEHAADSPGPWTTLAHGYSGATYSHTGSILLPGTTHYYRVAARKGELISAWAYVQATTEIVDGTALYVPGWPMNLRFTRIDRTAVTLAWDPPADDGGSRVTGYEYRVFGPCPSGADAVCDIVAPTRVSGTSRSISGLNREGTYQFEVRALNVVGAGDWSQSIQRDVGPATAGGGRVILSPSRLTVREGGEATYRVKLSRNPTLPIVVFMHWNLNGTEDEALGSELPFQQGQVLLPTGYDLSGLPDSCEQDHDWKENAYAWNVGVPITVEAPEDDEPGNGRLVITHDLGTVSAECLGNPADYAPDPVYDGMFGLALTVTERDND